MKLIAEPWDLGAGGYQVGNFPVLWTEWNGKYRDAMRAFWKGDDRGVAELATRLAGSNDLYEHSGRRPYASINFITAHDGFTLHDLVSYNEKHNEANGEDNRDGENHNLSWNCGAEGPTDDPAIAQAARAAEAQPDGDAAALAGRADDQRRRRDRPHAARQQQRLLPGQRAELDAWDLSLEQQQFLAFTRRLVRFRRVAAGAARAASTSTAARSAAPTSRTSTGSIRAGREMTDEAWNAPFVRSLGVLMVGNALDEVDERGRQVRGDTLLILLNAHHEEVPFALPTVGDGTAWVRVIDTIAAVRRGAPRTPAATTYPLQGRTLARVRACNARSAAATSRRRRRRRRCSHGPTHALTRSARTRRRRVARRRTDAAGRRRVVIERVQPEIDGGRFPIKRTRRRDRRR